MSSDAPTFVKLNEGWNAEPNAPNERIDQAGPDLILSFRLNPWGFSSFGEGAMGVLRFRSVFKFRLGPTNDEAWYLGKCRYSRLAPAWGEFYEIMGPDPLIDAVDDWKVVGTSSSKANRHFLFYLRDSTFEAVAEDWTLEPRADNALMPLSTGET